MFTVTAYLKPPDYSSVIRPEVVTHRMRPSTEEEAAMGKLEQERIANVRKDVLNDVLMGLGIETSNVTEIPSLIQVRIANLTKDQSTRLQSIIRFMELGVTFEIEEQPTDNDDALELA